MKRGEFHRKGGSRAGAASKDAEPPVLFVESAADLAKARELLADAPWFAIDTEFIGERTYMPRIELVQIAAPGHIVLIDMQAVPDLAPLAPLLLDTKREKILHASGQDLELLRRALGAVPSPVFDTQLAGAFLGRGLQVSLANLVSQLLGHELDSRQTTSDWSVRPLTQEQLRYAAHDVAHLGAIRDQLRAELEKAGRLTWFEEEQKERLEEVVEPGQTPDEEAYRRVKNGTPLKPRELAFLRDLAAWRERTARKLDMPRKQVLTDEGLVELAMHLPKSREEISHLRRVPKRSAMRFANEIFDVLELSAAVPKEQWPQKQAFERRQSPPPGVLEVAQAVLRREAERHGIAPALLATTDDLYSIISARPGERARANVPLMVGWRFEVAGSHLLKLLEGGLLVRVTPSGLDIVEAS